jgi:hypothetical protein
MELVEGDAPRSPMPLATALHYARQIADALDAAHEKSIVHRDLKPANIKIRGDGTVKVLDFGLAKIVSTDSSDGSQAHLSDSPTMPTGMTQAGMILGTAAYMSPEQARGKPVDKRDFHRAVARPRGSPATTPCQTSGVRLDTALTVAGSPTVGRVGTVRGLCATDSYDDGDRHRTLARLERRWRGAGVVAGWARALVPNAWPDHGGWLQRHRQCLRRKQAARLGVGRAVDRWIRCRTGRQTRGRVDADRGT